MIKPEAKTAPPQSLRPPQFGLRTLLLLVTACGMLLALSRWTSPVVVVLLVFLAVSIFCHVVGNAIGTRLREIGDGSSPSQSPDEAISFRRPQAHDFAPATRLSERHSLGLSIVIASS